MMMKEQNQKTMTRTAYDAKAKEVNAKYPQVKAEVRVSPWGGRLEIEVSSVDKAKALAALQPTY